MTKPKKKPPFTPTTNVVHNLRQLPTPKLALANFLEVNTVPDAVLDDIESLDQDLYTLCERARQSGKLKDRKKGK